MTYNEFLEQYGGTRVKFKSYYKFSFCFTAGNDEMLVFVGGSADDIYRMDVAVGQTYSVAELEPYQAYINGKTHFF
jgi:hypothetical protein